MGWRWGSRGWSSTRWWWWCPENEMFRESLLVYPWLVLRFGHRSIHASVWMPFSLSLSSSLFLWVHLQSNREEDVVVVEESEAVKIEATKLLRCNHKKKTQMNFFNNNIRLLLQRLLVSKEKREGKEAKERQTKWQTQQIQAVLRQQEWNTGCISLLFCLCSSRMIRLQPLLFLSLSPSLPSCLLLWFLWSFELSSELFVRDKWVRRLLSHHQHPFFLQETRRDTEEEYTDYSLSSPLLSFLLIFVERRNWRRSSWSHKRIWGGNYKII